MQYQEFVEEIRKQVEEQAGEGVKVNVSRILKNNLEPIDGLTILHRGDNVSRAIWLNPLFQRCQYGVPVSQIAEEILEFHEQNREIGSCDISFYTDFRKVRDHIACKLIHRGLNQELLKEVPHRPFLDLEIVYYYKIENSVFGSASILVKTEHAEIWGTTEEELYQIAMENTLHLQPVEFTDILDLISQMTDDGAEFFCRQEVPMYVLTNQEKNFGAAGILFPSVLKEIGIQLERDYYVLPSSIHECIIIPTIDGMVPRELHELVAEINSEHVADEELLGDSVYRYDLEKGELTRAYPCG